jgi:hypothetical protein
LRVGELTSCQWIARKISRKNPPHFSVFRDRSAAGSSPP